MKQITVHKTSSEVAAPDRVRQGKGLVQQDRLASGISDSPAMVAQRKKLQGLFGGAVQRVEEDEPLHAQADMTSTAQLEGEVAKPNRTGLPDSLKSGIESLSGISMDGVKVHYNSSQPAQLNALAYARGTEIHVASGQERHLPHEAWHVVQQAQGRVQPTMQLKDGVAVNDDLTLEQEADAMGARALQSPPETQSAPTELTGLPPVAQKVTQRAELASDKLNVAGENHSESGPRRADEARYSTDAAKGGYWTEAQFKVAAGSNVSADDFALRVQQLIAFGQDSEYGKWLDMDTDKLVGYLIIKPAGVKIFETAVSLLRPDELEFYKDYIPAELYNQYSGTLINQQSFFDKCLDIIRTSLAEYGKTKTTEWREKLMEAVQLLQVSFGILALQIDQVAQALSIVSSDDISMQRSAKMHAAGNTQAGTLGLWKVGDKHAADMETMGGQAYNLLRRTDFNAGYDLYMARRASLAKIKAVTDGNWGPYTKGLSSRPTGVSAIKAIIDGAGGDSAGVILTKIQARAAQDNARNSSNRHQKTKDFYAALSGMNMANVASMQGIPGLMDGIKL